MHPRLSLVILTRNEAKNIAACLRSVARQDDDRFETILIDAASTDGTVAIARRAQKELGLALRIEASDRLVPIGEARNLGVQMAQADCVAFLSADAELEPGWMAQAIARLETHDMVFGKQVHEPHVWNVGASVRGLRYHFPDGEADDPLVFASNVAAAYRKEVVQRFPFDPEANAAEDLLLARRAAAAGYTATYAPGMVVRHHDVSDWRQEMKKNVREGEGCAVYADELGIARPWLIWGGLVAVAGAAALTRRAGWGLLAGALWLPALRRAGRRARHMPPAPLVLAVAATPVFDLAFLYHYVRGLSRRPPPPLEVTP